MLLSCFIYFLRVFVNFLFLFRKNIMYLGKCKLMCRFREREEGLYVVLCNFCY